MRFKDIIFKFDFENIVNRLIELYPDSHKESYFHAITELVSLKPKKTTIQISVKEFGDVQDKRDYIDVRGIDKKCNNWALDFTDWREILSMQITQDSINYFSLLDITCHILWEITFNGYTNNDVQTEIKKLIDRVKDIKDEDLDRG